MLSGKPLPSSWHLELEMNSSSHLLVGEKTPAHKHPSKQQAEGDCLPKEDIFCSFFFSWQTPGLKRAELPGQSLARALQVPSSQVQLKQQLWCWHSDPECNRDLLPDS